MHAARNCAAQGAREIMSLRAVLHHPDRPRSKCSMRIEPAGTSRCRGEAASAAAAVAVSRHDVHRVLSSTRAGT